MTLELPIEEYFRYHPPTTPERIALHERVNRESLEICKAFIELKNYNEWLAIRDAAILLAIDVCCDETCLAWAKSAIDSVTGVYSMANTEARSTAILMNIQQFRMFLNQGITVHELKRQQLAEGVSAVVTADTPQDDSRLSRNREIEWKLLDQGILDISYFEDRALTIIAGMKRQQLAEEMVAVTSVDIGTTSEVHRYSTINLTLDGDKWCALIGENLQQGVGGFGDDPIEALSDLYAKLEGLDFVNIVNTIGVKIPAITYKVRDRIELFSDFINAYGKALFVRTNEGFTEREILIADWVGDNLVEQEDEIGGGT
jgi:hypothetical protein